MPRFTALSWEDSQQWFDLSLTVWWTFSEGLVALVQGQCVLLLTVQSTVCSFRLSAQIVCIQELGVQWTAIHVCRDCLNCHNTDNKYPWQSCTQSSTMPAVHIAVTGFHYMLKCWKMIAYKKNLFCCWNTISEMLMYVNSLLMSQRAGVWAVTDNAPDKSIHNMF